MKSRQVVAHNFNSSTQKAVAGRSEFKASWSTLRFRTTQWKPVSKRQNKIKKNNNGKNDGGQCTLCCCFSQIIAVNVIIDITEHGGTQLSQQLEDRGGNVRVQGQPELYITPCLKKKKSYYTSFQRCFLSMLGIM